MFFRDIPGHDGVKERLRAMADTGHLPHALLLEGHKGAYKLALARAFAQYIQCSGRSDGDTDSCGVCRACRLNRSMNHLDTIYIYPVVKSDSGKTLPVSDSYIEQWREFVENSPEADIDIWAEMLDKKNANPTIYVNESEALIHRLSLTGRTGRRVVLIWLPERMNTECANKLLKLIEEPGDDVQFLLVSDDSRAILPTIYSRAQRVEIKPLPDSAIADILVRQRGVEPTDAVAMAHNAEGDVIRALRATELRGAECGHFERFVQLMRLAYQRDVSRLRLWANDLASLDREVQRSFYTDAQRLVRENFVSNFGIPELIYMTRSEMDFSVRFARFITVDNVEKLISVFNRASSDIGGNANGKIVNFDVALKVCFLLKHQ